MKLRRNLFAVLGVLLFPGDANSFAIRAQGIPASPFMEDSTVLLRNNNNNSPFQTSIRSTTLRAVPGEFAAAAFLPTCLGLWRTGYAVSYGYGGAMLASALVQLSKGAKTLGAVEIHAAVFALYGARLCAFLFQREQKLPEDRKVLRKKEATLGERLKRLPLLVGCSMLYYCMAAPSMKILKQAAEVSPLTNWMSAIGFCGFLLAAVGDWYKSYVKSRDGPDTLVTTGPFRHLRHPNYTGEIWGWTFLCVLTPLLNLGKNLRQTGPWMLASVLGWAGIVFAVLAGEATAGLEKKQREKYGGTPEYEAWLKTSWSGPMVGGNISTPPKT